MQQFTSDAIPQISPNHRTFSNSQESSTQPLPKPTLYASQNIGFENDKELFEPIPPARYPPKYETSIRYDTTDGIPASQNYPTDEDKHFSPTPRRVEIGSSRQPTIPRGMTQVSTELYKSSSTSNLAHDQNMSHAATGNLSRSALKIVSPRKQSENLNVKRPNLQIIQQEFREQQDQRL